MAVILRKRQLRWAGHVVRMNNDRLPKQVMYSARAQHRTKERGQATAPLQGHTERRPEEVIKYNCYISEYKLVFPLSNESYFSLIASLV